MSFRRAHHKGWEIHRARDPAVPTTLSTWYHTSLLHFSYGAPAPLRNHHTRSIVCICKELGHEKESIMPRYSVHTVPLRYRKLPCNLQNL